MISVRLLSSGFFPRRLPAFLALLCLLPFLAPAAEAAGTFSLTGALGAARRGHTAVRLPDARVLVAGGVNQDGTLASAELYDPGTGAWTGTGSLGVPRSGHTAVLLQNGKVLVNGGRSAGGEALASAELYDPATGQWTPTGSMRAARRHHTATVLKNGNVLVVAGSPDDGAAAALDSSEIYNPATGAWRDGGLLTYARGFHTASLMGDYVVIIGGVSGGVYNTVIELYRMDRGDWDIVGVGPGSSDRARKLHTVTLLPNFELLMAGGFKDAPLATSRLIVGFGVNNTGSLTNARSEHTATLLSDGRVLAVGGVNGAGTAMAEAETYTRSNGQWTVADSLKTARAGHTATLLNGGRVLITGGYGADGALSSCELLTPEPSQWTETAPMFTGRQYHSSTLLPDGRVLVAGGFGWYQAILGNAEIYSPVADSWASIPGFTQRAGHSAVLLPDGRVLMTGGFTDMAGANISNATTLFDPASRSWTASGALLARRAFHAAVPLPDGRVLVAGGHARSGQDTVTLASVEIYDPATGVWSAAAPMSTGRRSPAATLLADGRIMVLSGMAEDYPPAAGTAEIYHPATNSWTAAAPLVFPHGKPAMTLLTDGKVLVTGGTDFNNTGSRGTAEIYDPALNTWQAAAPMLTEGLYHHSLLLQDGKVLVTGSYHYQGNGNSRGKAELYDPVANTWSSAGGFTPVWHNVSMLLNGGILLTGGQINGIDPGTVRTQVFDPWLASRNEPRPVLAAAAFDGHGRLVVSGSGFAGAASGEAPVVKLRQLNGERMVSLPVDPATGWTDTAFTSTPVTGFPLGYAMVSVFVNGVPSASSVVSVPVPELRVEKGGSGSGEELADGEEVDFGVVKQDESTELSFVVKNTGAMALRGLAVTITGTDATSFTPVQEPAETVKGPDGGTAFRVRFSPGSPGLKSAALHLASTDPDDNPFTLALTGHGLNTAPVVIGLADFAIHESGQAVLRFEVTDAETPDSLILSAVSYNEALLPSSGIVFSGTGSQRTVTLNPLPGRSGGSLITVTADDGGLQSAAATFILTVLPVNDPPTLAAIPTPAALRENGAGQRVGFQGVSSGTGDPESVIITAESSNPGLIPNPVVTYIPSAPSGYLEFTPAPDRSGTAVITVAADDAQGGPDSTVSQSFTVRVLPLIRGEAAVAEVSEGNEGVTPLRFRIFIGDSQPEAVTVNYTTAAAGTAQAGSDFTAAAGTAVIAAGQTETFVEVEVRGDADFESDETVALTLSAPSGAFLQSTVLTGTIKNDDAQPTLALTPASVTEGASGGPFQVWVKASLAAPSTLPLSWTVATRAGRAVEGTDFKPLGPVTLTFAPGETVKWAVVEVTGAGQEGGEDDEDFYLEFTPQSGPASVLSVFCLIQQLTVRDFIPLGQGVYALRFPTGTYQSYIIEEADGLTGPWTPASTVLTGSGSVVTQVVFSEKPRGFFRVKAVSSAQAAAAVGP